jgi:N-acetylglutamate synthase-like GNAT family acetyltransferase
MKKKLFFLFMAVAFLNIKAGIYKIEKIESPDLSAEYRLFQEFKVSFAHESLELIGLKFCLEEKAYKASLENRIFLHALLGDRVIGYISADVISGRQIFIREWAVDPELFEAAIIKDLLFAVLAKIKKIQLIRISCPADSEELVTFFQNLGFVCLEDLSDQSEVIFEFKANTKCQLCELLYGNIWGDDFEEDELEAIMPVPNSQMAMSDAYYN